MYTELHVHMFIKRSRAIYYWSGTI